MKINDLSHVETVTESVIGGISYPRSLRSAKARASAEALTIGRNTFSFTATSAYAVAGIYAASSSRSYASAQ
jgi:hypothetical protein